MDQKPGARRAGRPTEAKLTTERIAAAALELIDERGWADLTMNNLAERLGVRAPSLYHHISGQHGLINLVRDLVVAEIDVSMFGRMPVVPALREFGLSYHAAFARHPNTIPVLSVSAIRDWRTFAMYETVMVAMAEGGWTGERSLEFLLALEYIALGTAFEWSAEELMIAPADALRFDAPLLASYVRERTDQQGLAISTFTHLLDRLIAMFESERDEPRAGTSQARPSQARPSPIPLLGNHRKLGQHVVPEAVDVELDRDRGIGNG